MSSRLTFTLLNDAVGASNPAIMTFHSSIVNQVGLEAAAMQIAAWIVGGCPLAQNSRITGVLAQAHGAAGGIAVPFDPDLWADIDGASGGSVLPAMTQWGTAFGSGGLAPLGTAITVTEHTASPGRSHTGRVFLPFPQQGIVSAAGTVSDAASGNIIGQWNTFLRNGVESTSGMSPVELVVKGEDTVDVDAQITHVTVSTLFGFLRSRRR